METKVKPNVLVAGFPRCGTTFLYKLIKQHPSVSVSKVKEIDFFNKRNTHFTMHPNVKNPYSRIGLNNYLKFFEKNKCIIDFGIHTAYDYDSPKRIKKALGDIKIIFLVREKNFQKSLYKINRLNAEISTKMSFEEYKTKYKEFLNYYSDFDKHIENFRKNFSNVLVINLIGNDEKKEIKKLLKFLELKPINFNYDISRNTQNRRKLPSRTNRLLRIFIISFPLPYYYYVRYYKLRKLLRRKFIKN